LLKIKPFFLESYATNLFRVASLCYKNKIKLSIPVVFSTGEKLLPHQRELIEFQFNAEVFDYYGCNETGVIAFECKEHHTMHVADEHILLEVVDEYNQPVINQPGNIILTDLDNYAMPFIRYQVGDTGILSDRICECGRELTVLDSVEGRTGDMLITSDGNILPPIIINTTFRNLRGIERYQVIQKKVGYIILRIQKNELFDPSELKQMLFKLKNLLGYDTEIYVKEEQYIEPTRRGKFRTVISEIKSH